MATTPRNATNHQFFLRISAILVSPFLLKSTERLSHCEFPVLANNFRLLAGSACFKSGSIQLDGKYRNGQIARHDAEVPKKRSGAAKHYGEKVSMSLVSPSEKRITLQ
jgi:hypothetical protein